MVLQSNIDKIIEKIENKGFATDCPPDNFDFFSHQNVSEYLNILNNDPNDELFPDEYDEPYYASIELNEGWGNCVAIYLTESNNKEKATAALNRYAEYFVRTHPDEFREW